ncbi:DDE-type integrase/transposase/recombinase [Streptomyces sp. NPDC023838]|uniref:DDE-type integrase/transposase/recombinase n=1 Tax=Streptomyces sp. NPDC023838 TaxID=3154325 RepID=UPI0033D772B8
MRTYSITGIRLRRRVRTTLPDPSTAPVEDLFQRDFTAPEPGRKYMGDITYLPLAGGEFLWLATVLDCFSRKIVGWSIADHMRTSLVADALRMAASTHGSLHGSVFHSDHGAQYGSGADAELCDQLGATRSMGAVGTSADNAACESFHASLKRETPNTPAACPYARTVPDSNAATHHPQPHPSRPQPMHILDRGHTSPATGQPSSPGPILQQSVTTDLLFTLHTSIVK